jgi:hypothetical protein
MAKIRTVKPELFRHEVLFEAEQESRLPLRLAFIGLFACCDREGRFRWQPRSLKLDILPYDTVDFSQVLNALLAAGLIKKYIWQDKCYGFIPSWHSHQSINKHEPASKLPDPEKCVPTDYVASSLQITMPDVHMPARATHMPTSLEVEMEVELEMEEEQEVEIDVEVESGLGANRNIVAPARRDSATKAKIAAIFNHWQTVLQHPNAVLDKKRHRLIQQALLNGYTVDQLCNAINGCAQTPHNLGENDRGQRYDGLHIILRDADQIERFIHNHHNPPRPPNPADKLLQANIFARNNWLQRKQTETAHEKQ